MTRPHATFWFEFASTYSYLTLQRAEETARAAGVDLIWRPFLLGPIFAEQGWSDSPFNLYPAKGRFMWRDMERRAASRGLPFRPPERFPAHSLKAARLAYAALEGPEGPAFCRAVSRASFGAGRDIADAAVLAECATSVGLDPIALAAKTEDPDIRPKLRAATDEARALGVFGAPSVTLPARDGAPAELFWGDDQFETALAWAVHGGPSDLTPR